jgi:hypothetical protein
MGIVGALVRSAQSYPALLPIIAFFLGASIWAVRTKRWVMAGATILSGSFACLLYTSDAPAMAARSSDPSIAGVGSAPVSGADNAGPGPGGTSAAAGGTSAAAGGTGAAAGAVVPAGGRLMSADRLHPRFPRDFPLPGIFKVESNSSGRREGTLTTRLRFRGEGADAVRVLRELGEKSGWEVDQKAPHRLVFRKEGRSVEAWFAFPAHSVVLDVSNRR